MTQQQVVITSDEAADTARSIRDGVSECYQHGTLTEFDRGMYQGQMTMVRVYMGVEKWIIQGIENEVDFFCRRARQNERQSS